MAKKISLIALIFMLVSQSIMSGIGGQNVLASELSESFVTDVALLDAQGQAIDAQSAPEYKATHDMPILLKYTWTVNDSFAETETPYTIQVPEEVSVAAGQQGDLLSSEQKLVGTFSVKADGNLLISLNEDAESIAGQSGAFTVESSFAAVESTTEALSLAFDTVSGTKAIQVNFQTTNSSQSDEEDAIPSTEDGTSEEQDEQATEEETAPEETTSEEETALEEKSADEEEENSETATEEKSSELEESASEETAKDATEQENEEQAQVEEQQDAEESKQSTEDTDELAEAKVQANAFETVEITENILTDFQLTLRDGSPLPDPLPNPNENEIELKVAYSFALPNDHTYAAGSTYTFDMPTQLNVFNEVNGNLGEYGTYQITTDGKVVFTFNENIENSSDITGWVEFYSLIDRDLEGDTTQIINVPVQEDITKEIVLNFKPASGKSISKKGTPDQRYNASTITWEIDFNKDLSTLRQAVLADPVADSKQSFVEGSIRIYELDVQLNGSVIQGDEVTNIDRSAFPIDFGAIDQAYRVVFETKIEDGEATKYPNTATLTSDQGTIDAGASVTVSRGKALEKRSTAYDAKTQTITWEVKYNYNENTIAQNEALLTDLFGENQQLIAESMEVVEISINPQTGAEVGKGTPFENFSVTDNGSEGFQLQFGQDLDKAYKITYKTKATDRVYENASVKNKVTANGNEATANRNVSQQVFSKSHTGSTDYQQKTTNWKIVFNSDNHLMQDVRLQDKLPAGLTLDSYTLTHGGVALVEGVDYSYSYNKETGDIEFVFTGANPVTKEVVIQYKTNFDQNRIGESKSYVNQANLTWIPENESTAREESRKASFTPNTQAQMNGSKSGAYNAKTKEITWTIGVNYNFRDIPEAIVEDLVQSNQNLDIESLEVYSMNLQANGNWSKGDKLSAEQYTVEEYMEEGQPGFRVNLGSINSPYVVEFKTNLTGELIQASYDNEAVLKDGDSAFPLDARVSVTNGGNYTTKDAAQSTSNEEVMNWLVKINATQSTIENAKVTDIPTSNQLLLKDSFVLYGTNVNENGSFSKNAEDVLEQGVDYTLTFKTPENGSEYFELSFAETIDRPYILEYNTFLMASHGETVSNDALLTGENITTEKTDSSKQHLVRYNAGDGGASGKVGQLTINKTDATTDAPLEGVEFTLFDKTGSIELYQGTTDASGQLVFDQLRFSDYVLKETKVPDGYVSFLAEGKTITIDQEVTEAQDAGNVEQIVNHPILHAVELTKTDADNPNVKLQGASFDLQMEQQGEFTTIRENLQTNEQGIIYLDELAPGKYQFIETSSPQGYLLSDEPIPFTIDERAIEAVEVTAVNKAIALTSVNGEKTWKDTGADERPETIKVNLLQNGIVVQSATVSAEDEWQYSFDDLYTSDALGNAYTYTVSEQPVDGYQSTVDGFDITNVRAEKMTVAGTKTWLDDNSEDRPATITVELLQNGELFDTQEVSLETGWTYQFTDLEKFDKDGQPYSYSITERAVEGYESTIDGFDVTNLRVGTVAVEGTKQWLDDNSDQRPDNITVELLQNGEVVDTKEVSAETDWNYAFNNLDQYDASGKLYEYSVQEQSVEGYQTLIDDYDITNLRVGETSVEGVKTWKDDNSSERPDMIKVNLLQNGLVIDTAEVTAQDEWRYAFEGLAKYDAQGKAFEYTVKEHGVPGYQSTIDGYDITNLRTDQANLIVTKAWLDDDSEERPSAVTMNLLQNGEVFESVEVTKDNDWSYEFKDLEVFDENGKAYVYTVEEEAVEGYTSTVNGFDVTNLRVGETSVEGSKTWLDDDSEERPETIVVNLLQNGEVIDTQEVSEETEWAYAFNELAKYDDQGKLYTYTVEEQTPEGYISTVDGFDLTNLRVGETSVEGSKTWLDDESVERPETIVVKLLQNGEAIDSQEVTAANDWQYQFTELAKYDEQGKAYQYEVAEVPVEGYQTEIDGYDLTNLRVGETSVEGTKYWLDDQSVERPETITIELLQNGEVIDTQEVSEETEWAYAFKELAKYDEQGVLYDYQVAEQPVEGYEATIDGFDLTNLRVGELSVEGSKIWEDGDFEGRPDAITVELLQNGEVIDSQEVTQESDWQYSFSELPKYDEQGKMYLYTVEEMPVEGYETTIDGFDIINNLVYGEVTLTKVDAEDLSRVLEGAVFELQNAQGEVVGEALTTGKDGTITIGQLQPGEYRFVETEAPAGYELDSTPIDFTIGLDEESAIQVLAKNSQIVEPEPETPETPENPSDSDKPENSDKPESGQSHDGGSVEKSDPEQENGIRLPNTATSLFNYGLLGLVFLALGVFLIRRRKKA